MSSKARCIPRSAARRVLRVQQRHARRERGASRAAALATSADPAGDGESITQCIWLSVSDGTAAALEAHRPFHSNDIEESQ